MIQTITVADADGTLRLDRWFRRHYPELAHGHLEKLLRTGQVRVDGKRAKSGDRVEPGQAIRVPPIGDAPAPADGPRQPRPRSTDRDEAALRDRIIYRDDWAIVIDKPPGLAVQGGTNTERHVDQLLDGLRFDSDERPRLVHRLDKDTSGVLVIARTPAAATHFTRAFRDKTTRKIYWAAVVGAPEMAQGRIELALAKLPGRGGERVRPDEDAGKDAITYYRVVDEAGERASWLALLPLTGRTHQLRAHCAAIGTPILGDGKYGGAGAHLGGGFAAHMLHLHARSLEIPHPLGGTLKVTAKLPPHMQKLWDFLGFASNTDDPFAELDLSRVKRLYRIVATESVAGGHAVTLDGKRMRTPGRRELLLPTAALAAAIAAEWDAQIDEIRPARMPLTRLAATAIDRTADQRDQSIAETATFAGTDLVCYRADHPPALAERQHAAWQPLLDWAAERYAARLDVTAGILPKRQSPATLARFTEAVATHDNFRLTGLHTATAACGSLIIALALAEGRLDAPEAFALSQLDETFQIEAWGEDAEAKQRREALAADIEATARFLALLADRRSLD